MTGTRPRVIMVVRLFAPWIGGTERQALKLSVALRTHGTATSIATGRWFTGTPRNELVSGVPVHRHHTLWEFYGIKGLRKFGGYLYILTLWWHLFRRRHDYDVIHCHGLNYHTFAAVVAGRRLGKPVIVKLANSGHASDILKMRESRQLAGARLMLNTALGCDRFVALTPLIAEELAEAGVDPDRIEVIPNGVEVPEPGAPPAPHDGPLRLLFLGRLHPNKRLETFIEALKMVTDDRPGSVVARLVGEGPERARLERLVARHRLEDVVSLPGETSAVEEELADADALVLPSAAEGLSNALLEAMASGLPVIVSDTEANTSVVTAGIDGLAFELDDAAALASQIVHLTDGDTRQRLGVAAQDTARARFSIDAVAAAYQELYDSVCGLADERSAQETSA